MKVYHRNDFLLLPAGTLFCKGVEWSFYDLCIKGETWENDFLYSNLTLMSSISSNDYFDKLDDSLNNGTSYFINQDFSRDGSFDDSELFLVYERKDLEYLEHLIRVSNSKDADKTM